jgi:hypothetical protein
VRVRAAFDREARNRIFLESPPGIGANRARV